MGKKPRRRRTTQRRHVAMQRRRDATLRMQRRRNRMMEREERSNRQNDYSRTRPSRNFYINVSNNSSRTANKPANKTATTNQSRPWVNRRQADQTGGGSWGSFWGIPKITDIIGGYNKTGAKTPEQKNQIRQKRRAMQKTQKGGIVAGSRKLAREAMRDQLKYYQKK